MTATSIALRVLTHLTRKEQAQVYEHLRKVLYLTPPYPEADARNSFNLAKKSAQPA